MSSDCNYGSVRGTGDISRLVSICAKAPSAVYIDTVPRSHGIDARIVNYYLVLTFSLSHHCLILVLDYQQWIG